MNQSSNDVHSKDFISKLDPYFTKAYSMDKWHRYSRTDKDEARSMLALTRKKKDFCYRDNP